MFKKCIKCNHLVYVIKDSNGISCCGNEMKELTSNSVDASFEKHVPKMEIINEKLRVIVNHVMEDDHYIEWIAQETENEIIIKKLNPGIDAIVEFNNIDNCKIYSYCNKHGLWVNSQENKDN